MADVDSCRDIVREASADDAPREVLDHREMLQHCQEKKKKSR